MGVRIIVEYIPEDASSAFQHSLTTWMIDPAIELAPEANEQIRDILTLEDI